MGQQRFVGILNSLDIVSFLTKSECLEDQEKAMKTPVSEVVVPNGSLLRQVEQREGKDVEKNEMHCPA
ncbi:hypothetical protein Dsin_022150 [Dipteronia sinensis]|uniref:CBS domain-containing protein n=1 Tax=Dipteronia sinensis TaxID=43782 RepID=A0AAE0A0Z0_9ROSI|nr:hypothetical protein Dsin_022150 [Dipteronia sinensis]